MMSPRQDLLRLPYFQLAHKPNAAPRFRRPIKPEWKPLLVDDGIVKPSGLYSYAGLRDATGDYDWTAIKSQHLFVTDCYDRAIAAAENRIRGRQPRDCTPPWVRFAAAEWERLGVDGQHRAVNDFAAGPHVAWPTVIDADREFIARAQAAGAKFGFASSAPVINHGAPPTRSFAPTPATAYSPMGASPMGNLAPEAAKPISAHVDAYIKEITRGGYTTQRSYRTSLEEMIAVVGNKAVSALTEADCKRTYSAMSDRGLEYESLKKAVRAIKRFGEWLEAHNYIGRNPAASLKVIKANNSQRWQQFTRDDIQTMLTALPVGDHRRTFLLFMLLTGADAPSELEKCDRALHQDFDQTRPHLLIRGTKAEGRTRYVPVHPVLLANGIETWLANPVWTASKYQYWFTREFLRSLGITGRKALKSFRSTFRSYLRAIAGLHPEAINVILGHTAEGTGTKHYAGTYPNDMAKLTMADTDLFDRLRYGITLDGLSF